MQKDGPPHACEIEVEQPDGKKVPRQEPFETLEELYVPLSRTSATQMDESPEKEAATAIERRLHLF